MHLIHADRFHYSHSSHKYPDNNSCKIKRKPISITFRPQKILFCKQNLCRIIHHSIVFVNNSLHSRFPWIPPKLHLNLRVSRRNRGSWCLSLQKWQQNEVPHGDDTPTGNETLNSYSIQWIWNRLNPKRAGNWSSRGRECSEVKGLWIFMLKTRIRGEHDYLTLGWMVKKAAFLRAGYHKMEFHGTGSSEAWKFNALPSNPMKISPRAPFHPKFQPRNRNFSAAERLVTNTET